MSWIIDTTTISSTGSIQKIVPAAPPQLYSPAEPMTPVIAGSRITPKPSPKPPPRFRRLTAGRSPSPPALMDAGRWSVAMNSTVFGLSIRTPCSSPPARIISANRR